MGQPTVGSNPTPSASAPVLHGGRFLDSHWSSAKAGRHGSRDPVREQRGVYVAYQVFGDGERDLVVIMDGFIPVDTMDDEPRLARSSHASDRSHV